MSETFLQFTILVLVGAFTLLFVFVIRHYLYGQLPFAPQVQHEPSIETSESEDALLNDEYLQPTTRVCILAFSSTDSVQCRQLQRPVLNRVMELKGEDVVSVMHIDISMEPQLAERYHVITVPTTVLLDAGGNTHAVNYGFTNVQSLLKQVDEILTLDGAHEALHQ